MTNKQDEGMTINKARKIVADRHINDEFWQATGFIEGWDARGVKDADHFICLTEDKSLCQCARCSILKLQSEDGK